MDDLIRRQDVLDALKQIGLGLAETTITLLPSISAVEVVRCRNCKHFAGDGMYCDNDIMVLYDHFYCYYGEKEDCDE